MSQSKEGHSSELQGLKVPDLAAPWIQPLGKGKQQMASDPRTMCRKRGEPSNRKAGGHWGCPALRTASSLSLELRSATRAPGEVRVWLGLGAA